MKTQFFTVGPTQLFPTVPKHYTFAVKNRIGEISHRGKEAGEIVLTTSQLLKELLGIPKTHHIFFLGSSLEAMERILENTVEKKSYHLVFGEFSKKFASFSEQLGNTAEVETISFDKAFDYGSVITKKGADLICLTQNETSTGIRIQPTDIKKIKKNNPHVLIASDIVSSTPYTKLSYTTDTDMAFFSVQKGFGMPAGLGVLVINEHAMTKAKELTKKKSIGTYHSFLSLAEKEPIGQTPETPNLLAIYVLGKVCEDLLKKGIETIRKETDVKADMLYEFFESHKEFSPLIKDKKARSQTSIVVNVNGKGEDLRAFLKKKGFVVSPGYGQYKKDHIRIANFPSQSVEATKKLITALKHYK